LLRARLERTSQRVGFLTCRDNLYGQFMDALGSNDCAALEGTIASATLDPESHARGLDRLIASAGAANFGVYELQGTAVKLLDSSFRSVSSGGTSLEEWLIRFRDGSLDWASVSAR
jgi:hypothetical protein